MRITIHARIEGEDGQVQSTVEIGVIERDAQAAPSSGLGLLLRDAHSLLQKLQDVVLQEQVARFVKDAATCRGCGHRLAIKDTKSLVYRTAYGKASFKSPRFYSRCAHCGSTADRSQTFSPLAHALPERVHPQWTWLQSRYASVMSYRLPQIFLRDAFPAGKSLAPSTIKNNVQLIGDRLEREARAGVDRVAHSLEKPAKSEIVERGIALQIDAGYIKSSVPQSDGTRWFAAIASKLVCPETAHTRAHAYTIGYDPSQGMRQQVFLASVGVGPNVPFTVLSDGGEDISHACQLQCPSVRILDWFHIGMRFEHLLTAVRGMRGIDQDAKTTIQREAMAAKWLVWHGQHVRGLLRLELLRRDTGWAGSKNPLGRLIRYLRGCDKYLVNYAARYHRGDPISSAGAEGVVDYVIGQRMKRNGHMRWSRRGANTLLQVRCAVLNGQDVRNFKRWYPPDHRSDRQVTPVDS